MSLKTIKISEENYKWLSRYSNQNSRTFSVDKALSALRQEKLNSLAGSWKMSDEEAEELKKNIRASWGTWKIPKW